MKIDVVCNKAVDEMQAEREGVYSDREGQRFYFCSMQCKETFEFTPGSFFQVMPEEPCSSEDRAWE